MFSIGDESGVRFNFETEAEARDMAAEWYSGGEWGDEIAACYPEAATEPDEGKTLADLVHIVKRRLARELARARYTPGRNEMCDLERDALWSLGLTAHEEA